MMHVFLNKRVTFVGVSVVFLAHKNQGVYRLASNREVAALHWHLHLRERSPRWQQMSCKRDFRELL